VLGNCSVSVLAAFPVYNTNSYTNCCGLQTYHILRINHPQNSAKITNKGKYATGNNNHVRVAMPVSSEQSPVIALLSGNTK